MIPIKVCEKNGTVIGVIVKVGGGEESGGGGTVEVSREDVEVFSSIVTLEPLLDNFSRMFEDIPTSILDLKIGPSGGVIVVVSGSKVKIGLSELMFIFTLDAFAVTS